MNPCSTDGTAVNVHSAGPASMRQAEPRLARRWPTLLAGALVAGVCIGASAQSSLGYTHLSTGAEDITLLDSGGAFSTFGTLDLTVTNASGADWTDYTLHLPDMGGGLIGSFGAVSLTAGAFTAVSTTPDLRNLGLFGGTVANGAAFSVIVGINYQLQSLVGAPTLASVGNPDPAPPYEPPPPSGTWPAPPSADDYLDVWNAACDDCWPVEIPKPENLTTLLSFTEVVNGVVTIDRIVSYDQNGEYAVIVNGFTESHGTCTSCSPAEFNDWASAIVAGQSPPDTLPVPEPGTWLMLLGGLASLGVIRRRRNFQDH